MAMPINARMDTENEGDAIYHDPAFQRLLETHLLWLNTHPDTVTHPLDPHVAAKYDGDFKGLMVAMGVPVQCHYITMVMNGMNGPQDFHRGVRNLRIPAAQVINSLRQRSKVITKKVS